MAFHWKDNWFFERRDDGSVRIYHEDRLPGRSTDPVEYDVCLDIDADSWASIVASVSAQGDTAEAFQEARNLHGKGRTVA